MAEVNRCPQCGCEMPPDSPAGLCPDCLLAAGLGASDPILDAQPLTEAKPGPGFVPPKPHELAGRFPQFEIHDLLGYGGMGAVYKARQKSLDRFVALKIIKPDAANDAGFAERFAREAKALARLNHSTIVGVYDFGESDGLFYFVMEYVDGTNLRRLIESKELSPEQALRIIPQVCEALQFAHDEGIVHRDIKPENILVELRPKKRSDPDCAQHPAGRSGNRGLTPFSARVRIADFGLAKLLGQTAIDDHTLTGTHQVMGTPRYMAPEQMEGSKAVDHRADIYSLGVVFYEMLTGELPMGSFEPPSRKAQVDVRLDEIVLRSLAKEPERRYQHASDVRTDVESLSSDDAGFQPGKAEVSRSSTRHEPKSRSLATSSGHEELSYDDRLPIVVMAIVFCGSILGLLALFLPWTEVHIMALAGTPQESMGGRRQGLEAEGYRYWLPIFGAALSFALFLFTLVKSLIGEFPTAARSMLSAAAGIALAVSGSVILCLTPLPNMPDEYSSVLSRFGHSFTDSAWSMRELQIMEVQGDIDLRVDLEGPGCFLAFFCGVALIVASVLEMRMVLLSRVSAASGNAAELLRGPATALRWAAWSSPVMALVLVVMNFNYSASRSEDATLLLVALVLQILHALLLMPLMLIGTARMEACLSRRLAIAVSIIAMLPFGISFAVGLPAGVWSLIVLARVEVERAFREQTVKPTIIDQQLRRAGVGVFITALVSLIFWIGMVTASVVLLILQIRRGDDIDLDPILFWLLLVALPLPIFLSAFHMFAARKVWKSATHGWAGAAAVFALIPFSPAWLIGLPFGVWLLAVLSQESTSVGFATGEKSRRKPPVTDPFVNWSHLCWSMCIALPILTLIGFALWYTQNAWVLAALALPWFGVTADQGYYGEKPDKKGHENSANLVCLFLFVASIAFVALAIAIEQAAWPLFSIVPILVAAIAGMGIGSVVGNDEAKKEGADAVEDDHEDEAQSEEEEEEDGESPKENLEWAAWWVGVIGVIRSWALLSNGVEVFGKIVTGESSALRHDLLLDLTGPVMVIAAIAMYHARFYHFAVVGAVLCLPTGNCMPVILGIWSLVVLFDPKVRALFLANEALLSATGSASADAGVTAKPPMPRGYGDAIGSTLGNAWTDWWRERDALFTRVMQTVIMLLHIVCLLAFLGFSGTGGTNDEGQRTFTHNIGFPAPWFTIETNAAHPDFSFSHEIHWSTSAWLFAGLGMGLAYIYCRIEKVRNPVITFWHKPEGVVMVWALLAMADIGLGAGMGYLAMNVKGSHKPASQEVAKAKKNPKRERGTDAKATELMEAVARGNISQVKAQLDAGASVNEKDDAGRTLLMQAIAGGHRSLALTLVVLGADLMEQDERGRTALMHAVEAKDKVFLSRLRKLQQVTYTQDADERKAELRAFSGVERSLLDGRDFDLRNIEYTDLERQTDGNGETASLIAARIGDWELYSQVTSHVDSLSARNNQGRTIAMYAAMHGHVEWFKRLSTEDTTHDVNFTGQMTPFNLDRLALTDQEGKTALQIAKENGHNKLAEVLRNHLQSIIDTQTALIEEDSGSLADRKKWLELARRALGENDNAEKDADNSNRDSK